MYALLSATDAFAIENLDAKLREFEKAAAAADKSESHRDELFLAAVAALEKGITAADLPNLETFALKKQMGFLVIPIFVRRGQFDPVARLATSALTDAEDRSYCMWKWWETMFGEQENFMKISGELGLAFANLYEKSDEAKRVVIADIFSKKLMSAEEFRRSVTPSSKEKK